MIQDNPQEDPAIRDTVTFLVPDKKPRSNLFLFLLIFCGIFLLLLNMKFSSVVGALYSHRQMEFLNIVSCSGENLNRPLDYYVGRIEDVWVGPFTSVVTGGLFLLFCLWFLQGAGSLQFWAATMLYLILSRPQVLCDPPYGDGLFGVFSEPLWLIRHHLDWIGLTLQNSYIQTGPLMYPESIYPKLISLLLYFSPSVKVFLLVNHLIVFAAGATLVTAFRGILTEFTDLKRATLGTVLFLALPIFQCHVELLNMETVCSCFAVLCLYSVLRKDFFLASAMAIFAMMVKVPGAITTIVLFGAWLLSLGSEPSKKKNLKNLLWVLIACLVALLLSVIRRVTMGEQPQEFRLAFMAGWKILKSLKFFLFFILLSALYVSRYLFAWVSNKKKGVTLPAFPVGYYKSLVFFLGAASWFLLYINSPTIIPRYTVLAMPFLALFFVFLFDGFIPRENIFIQSMAVIVLCSLACSHGLFYSNEKEHGDNNSSERSLEYRNVLKVNIRAAQFIERNYPDYTIGTYGLMALALAFKEAGYVTKPLKDIFVYGYGATHQGIRPYPGLQNINIMKTIWVAQTDGDPGYLSKYPIGPADMIIKEIWAGDKRMTLFMGGFSIEVVAKAVLGY